MTKKILSNVSESGLPFRDYFLRGFFFVAKLIGSFQMNHVVKMKISKACLISVVIFYKENKESELIKQKLLKGKNIFGAWNIKPR